MKFNGFMIKVLKELGLERNDLSVVKAFGGKQPARVIQPGTPGTISPNPE